MVIVFRFMCWLSEVVGVAVVSVWIFCCYRNEDGSVFYVGFRLR